MDRIIFSHNKDEWFTPQQLFDDLNDIFHFTLDPCATDENHKCFKYYTKEEDGLLQDWSDEVVWCNPPYSDLKSWTRKCAEEGNKGTKIVLLIPARTDTRWFHEYCLQGRIWFMKGRIKFGGCKDNAPFPNLLITYNF